MNLENLTTKIEQFYFTFRHGDFANKVAGYTITIDNEKVKVAGKKFKIPGFTFNKKIANLVSMGIST